MNTLRKTLQPVLMDIGFAVDGKAFRRGEDAVVTLIGLEKGFGNQWFINVGFWIRSLGQDVPDKVEKAHLYFRLERLFPEVRETILAAGAVDEPESLSARSDLVELVRDSLNTQIAELANEEALRSALETGRLSGGLVMKEARQYLAAL